MAKNTQTDPITPTVIIILLVLTAALAYWFGFAGQKVKSERMVTETQQMDERSDLNAASDELDSANLDATDQGVTDLQLEVSRY